MESKVVVPAQGKKITLQNGKLNVPENPIIPYIEGDGIGVDVTPAMLKVVDAAVEKAYKGERKISWMDESSGRAQTTQASDQESVNRYGNLLYYKHETDKSTDVAKLQEKAKLLLKLYNHEAETIKLSCLGDHSVRAGCSIFGSVEDIGLNRRVIVKSVTHKYLPVHTMEVEVIAN